jgi:hypothetical protein
MREAASNAGRKLVAVAVLLLGAYLLFKVVIGTLMAVFWIIVAVVAVVAVIWAIGTLRS